VTARRSSTTSPTPATSPSPAPTSLPDDEANALAQVLAAEHAAVYAYGVVGAQCDDDAHRDLAEQRLQQHAARRDLLAARLATAQRTAPPAAPAYGLPFAVDTPAEALDLAAHVELAVAAANADLVAAAAPERRLEPARWLGQDAVAARTWRARSTAFPGLPERSS
jgi:hypothetical protein